MQDFKMGGRTTGRALIALATVLVTLMGVEGAPRSLLRAPSPPKLVTVDPYDDPFWDNQPPPPQSSSDLRNVVNNIVSPSPAGATNRATAAVLSSPPPSPTTSSPPPPAAPKAEQRAAVKVSSSPLPPSSPPPPSPSVPVVQQAAATKTADPAPTSGGAPTSALHGGDYLELHNRYRAYNHAPPLVRSSALEAAAQKWADHLAATCGFSHSTYGENLAAGQATWDDVLWGWYGEYTMYDFKKANFSYATGHFTQMVWRSSTKLGCGRAENSCHGPIYVCQYDPIGNVVTEVSSQVLAP